VLDAAPLSEAELGAFLRKRGLQTTQLSSWRTTIAAALSERPPRKPEARSEQQRIRVLEKELLRKDRALAEVTALLALRKKSRDDLEGRGRGRGRRHDAEEREVIGLLVPAAVQQGARRARACATLGLKLRPLQRWQRDDAPGDRRTGPRRAPGNRSCARERAQIVETVPSPEYHDLSPKQIVARLADRGIYLASESTIYRLLRACGQLAQRAAARPAQRRVKPRLQATAPNRVWCWDITYLKSPVLGRYYYLYLVVDLFSRKIVAATVHDRECRTLAA